MNDFLKEYKSRTMFTKKEAKAILTKFLLIHGVLQEYAKCYNDYQCNKKTSVKDTIDFTINYVIVHNVYYNDIFNNMSASFSWSTSSNPKLWSKLHKIWFSNVNPRAKVVIE